MAFSNTGLYARRFESNHAANGSVFQLSNDDFAGNIQIANIPGTGYMALYRGRDYSGTNNYDIIARKYSYSNTAISTPIIVNSILSGN